MQVQIHFTSRSRWSSEMAHLGVAVLGTPVLGVAVVGIAVLGIAVLGTAVLGSAVLGVAVLVAAMLHTPTTRSFSHALLSVPLSPNSVA